MCSRLTTAQYNGLQTVDDYTNLYDGEWGPSSQPTGIDPGMLSNYTSVSIRCLVILIATITHPCPRTSCSACPACPSAHSRFVD